MCSLLSKYHTLRSLSTACTYMQGTTARRQRLLSENIKLTTSMQSLNRIAEQRNNAQAALRLMDATRPELVSRITFFVSKMEQDTLRRQLTDPDHDANQWNTIRGWRDSLAGSATNAFENSSGSHDSCIGSPSLRDALTHVRVDRALFRRVAGSPRAARYLCCW